MPNREEIHFTKIQKRNAESIAKWWRIILRDSNNCWWDDNYFFSSGSLEKPSSIADVTSKQMKLSFATLKVEVEFLREKLGQLSSNCFPRNQEWQSQPVGGFILKKLHATETAFINSKTCSFEFDHVKLKLVSIRTGTMYSNNAFYSIMEPIHFFLIFPQRQIFHCPCIFEKKDYSFNKIFKFKQNSWIFKQAVEFSIYNYLFLTKWSNFPLTKNSFILN